MSLAERKIPSTLAESFDRDHSTAASLVSKGCRLNLRLELSLPWDLRMIIVCRS